MACLSYAPDLVWRSGHTRAIDRFMIMPGARYLVVAIAGLVLAASCSDGTSRSPFPADTHVIFPASEAPRFAEMNCVTSAIPSQAAEFWTPTEAQIEELEPRLYEHLRATRTRIDPESYVRQYAGFIVDGRQIIYVNGLNGDVLFNGERRLEWRESPIWVCDGGTLQFSAEYDPEEHRFLRPAFED